MAIDLTSEWPEIFFKSDIDEEDFEDFSDWLKDNRNTEVILYHGTKMGNPIMEKGLLPTTKNRRNSLQSRSGYVSLSVFPGNAEMFGDMIYPREGTVVYAVTIPISKLVPDLDQLKNKRYWGEDKNIPSNLAASFAYGYGAQVKGAIEPWRISVYKETRKKKSSRMNRKKWSLKNKNRILDFLDECSSIYYKMGKPFDVAAAKELLSDVRGLVEKIGNYSDLEDVLDFVLVEWRSLEEEAQGDSWHMLNTRQACYDIFNIFKQVGVVSDFSLRGIKMVEDIKLGKSK